MKTLKQKQGFSLVELMVSALVGAVLALTVGSMIVFGYQAWSNNSASVKIQGEASLAMMVLGRYIRESGMNDMLIDGVAFSDNKNAIGSRIDFAANAVRTNSAAIVEASGQLSLEPDGFVLIGDGALSDFTAQFNPAGPAVEIRVVVAGAHGLADTVVRASFTPRN